jgi:hypothetical protein
MSNMIGQVLVVKFLLPNKPSKPAELQIPHQQQHQLLQQHSLPHQHPLNKVILMRGESTQSIPKPPEQIRSFTPQRTVIPNTLTSSYSKGFIPSSLFSSQKSTFFSRQDANYPSDSNIPFMNDKLDDSKMKSSKIERKMGLSLVKEQRNKLVLSTEVDSVMKHHGKENNEPRQAAIN